MPLLDFYEIRDFQAFDGQQILNIYHYKKVDPGATATVMGTAFIESILPTLVLQQVVGITRTVLEVENLGSPFDFAAIDTSGSPGAAVGAPLSSFEAASIQLNRTRNDMKNGAKRLAAGTEGSKNGNDWAAPFITAMQVIADLLVTPIVLDATPLVDRGELVVLKRFCTVQPPPSPCPSYRLPDTDLEIDANHYVPVTATMSAVARSQVSRKRLL